MKMKSIFLCLIVTFCSNTFITVYAQAVNKQDSLALVDFYNSTNGPQWNHNDNWLKGAVTSWYGVTVTGTRVTAINIGSNNLNGKIPASIGNLSNLITFHLY